MPHGIDLLAAPSGPPQVGQCLAENEERIAYFFLAGRVPIGRLQFPDAVLADRDRILQGMDLLGIVRIGRIDQRSDRREHIAGADRLPVEGVRSLAVDDRGHVVVLVDDHHRHETGARIR